MAEEDIYGNKGKYERIINNLDNLLKKPKRNKGKYYCKNKENLKYYNKVIRYFEVNDLSYIRRIRLISTLKFLTCYIECDLKDVNGIEMEEIIIKVRETYSVSILRKIEGDVKQIGRILFDEKIPKFFKEFKIKTDISRQKARKDKLTYEEFEKIMKFFSMNCVIQAYLSIAFETLTRPQELCYIKIGDCEFYENHAILNVSEHGKEGIKKLLCIDSYPYLVKMYKQHRYSKDHNSYLFLNEYGNQLTPYTINKKLKRVCNKLKIDKPITCYSLKRFGVTFRRLNGDDDVTIQKIAGWTSIKQLKIYDQSDQNDVFKRELAKRGLLNDEKYKKYVPQTKPCPFCGEIVGFAENTCEHCKHIIDRDLIKKQVNEDQKAIQEIKQLLKFATEHPEMKMIDIMEKFRGKG